MPDFKTLLVRTDVIYVIVVEDKVVAGIGGHLHIYDIKQKTPLHVIEIFQGSQIYGIVPNETNQKYLIHGERHLKQFHCASKKWNNFKEISHVRCTDWILEAKWLNRSNNVATIFMHNVVILWTKDMEIVKKIACEETGLLYSAYLVNATWDNLIVLSGTVISDILIWWPNKCNSKNTCPVLYTLKGHKGVIFSIHYNPTVGIICSTSDDRAAIFWSVRSINLETELMQPDVNIQLKVAVLGHTARVFRCRVLDEYVLTAGEDSLVNVWNLEGRFIRKLEAHQSASIWGLNCSEKNNIIVTGGGDSSVTLFPLSQKITKISTKGSEPPKRLVILSNNDVVTISEKGLLEYYCFNDNQWSQIAQHEDLICYSLLKVSLCRKLVGLAGFSGTIHIYKQMNNTLKRISFFKMENKPRIYSFHWLTSTSYLTCGPEGILTLWNLKENESCPTNTFHLPTSKSNQDRESTAACIWGSKYLAVGDRNGNLHIYSWDSPIPAHIIKKAHNHLGITNLYCQKNELISLGRNSVFRKYYYDDKQDQFSVVSSDKLPFSWLAALHKLQNCTLILSFFGTDFVVWDYARRSKILELECGGGHRSWDFFEYNNEANFVYIKDKHINVTRFNWNSICPYDTISGFHSSEINSLCCLSFPKLRKCLLISGGEDTTLRISKVDFNKTIVDFANLSVLKSHLSSIRTITTWKIGETTENGNHLETHLIFSGGGRGQIVLWELQVTVKKGGDITVRCSEKFSYYENGKCNPEMRIMDMCCIEHQNDLLLIASCSDGSLKVFLIATDCNKYKLVLIKNVSYFLRCIFTISHFKMYSRNIIVSMATDGLYVFWDFTELLNNTHSKDIEQLNVQYFQSIPVHQSGINSFMYKMIDESHCMLLSGGDDSALVANLCRFTLCDDQLQVKVISRFTDTYLYWAQISGVFFSNNYFLATSGDQFLNIYEWKIANEKLDCKSIQRHSSPIGDIHGMKFFEEGGDIYIFLYGKGIEFCKCKVNP